jgi:hypothetical protein
MTTRRKILFKVDNAVMVEELRDLSIEEIERLKVLVAQECECNPEDVEVDTIEAEVEMSEDVDATDIGFVFWRSLSFEPIVGVRSTLIEGSDEYLDAVNNGTLENYLEFFTERLA